MADFTTSGLISLTVARVKAAYAASGAVIWALTSPAYEAVKSIVAASAVTQQTKDFIQLGKFIDDWATRRAVWAANGVRDDGSAYTLDRWVLEGQGYAEDAWQRAGLTFDSSFFADAAVAAKTLVVSVPKDLAAGYAAATSPTKWPWYLQVGVVGVGLFYASQIWANFRGKK